MQHFSKHLPIQQAFVLIISIFLLVILVFRII